MSAAVALDRRVPIRELRSTRTITEAAADRQ